MEKVGSKTTFNWCTRLRKVFLQRSRFVCKTTGFIPKFTKNWKVSAENSCYWKFFEKHYVLLSRRKIFLKKVLGTSSSTWSWRIVFSSKSTDNLRKMDNIQKFRSKKYFIFFIQIFLLVLLRYPRNQCTATPAWFRITGAGKKLQRCHETRKNQKKIAKISPKRRWKVSEIKTRKYQYKKQTPLQCYFHCPPSARNVKKGRGSRVLSTRLLAAHPVFFRTFSQYTAIPSSFVADMGSS